MPFLLALIARFDNKNFEWRMIMRKYFLLVFGLFLIGCSTSGTSVLIGEGGPYSATDPASIVLLLEPPPKSHKIIALVEGVAATDDYFTKQKTEQAAIEAMKKEAARIGANAIVLTGKNSAPYGQVTTGYTSATGTVINNSVSTYGVATATTMGWEKITFSGTAIRFTDEKSE
jgi:hypothetical protein